jgi:hypothetical protein
MDVHVHYYKYIIQHPIWELIFMTIHNSEETVGIIKGYGLTFNLINVDQAALTFSRNTFSVKGNYYNRLRFHILTHFRNMTENNITRISPTITITPKNEECFWVYLPPTNKDINLGKPTLL